MPLRLITARDILDTYGRNRDVLRCVTFAPWPGRMLNSYAIGVKFFSLYCGIIGVGMYCIKSDVERFLLCFSRTLDAEMPDFLSTKIREVRDREEVRLNS